MKKNAQRRRPLALLAAIILVPPFSMVLAPTGPLSSPAEASTTIGSDACQQAVTGTLTGSVAQDGNDCVVAFTAGSGQWTVPSGVSQIDYVVVGGGGGGGRGGASDHGGGGGGAGGVIQRTGVGVAAGVPLTVAVGQGGAGATGDSPGMNGEESSVKDNRDFPLAVALGGGRGGDGDSPAQTGGSGGGGAARNTDGTHRTGSVGTMGQGSAGGSVTAANSTLNKNAAGGGGAGDDGETTSGRPGTDPLSGRAGNGGIGVSVSWLATGIANDLGVGVVSGSDVYFGGGGGGGAGSGEAQKSAGGLGGGGAGGYFNDSRTSNGVESGNNGLPNAGGGGGGGTGAGSSFFGPGGSGGSGVVIVRFSLPAGDLGCAPSSPATVGDYQVLTFSTVGACEWTVPDGISTVDVLVVGGGGGGGARIGGGGGGGGVIEQTVGLTGTDTVSVTVGFGGVGGTPDGTSSLGRSGANGGPSGFGTATAAGGGGGGGSGVGRNGSDGATGGGGGFGNLAGNGDPGGDGGGASAILSNVVVVAGGGGGSSENGGNFSGDNQAGAGGNGTLSAISGQTLRYGGGGGGGVHTGVVRQAFPGAGGDGGGGAGASIAFTEGGLKGAAGQSGEDGRGGGGGGGSVTNGDPLTPNGGNGGSGVVIVRWATTPFNITIVDSGGADEGDGWAESGGVISATRDVSIDADDIEAKLAGGPLKVDGRNITVNGAISYVGTSSTLTLRGTQRVMIQKNITSTNSPLNLVFWSDYEDNGTGGVSISNGATLTTNGGHVWAGGSSESQGSDTWNGLTVGDGPSVGADGFNYYSLDLQGSISSGGGDVLLWAGDARSEGEEGLAVKTFGTSTNPSITTGTGDLTLITKQLFNWDNTNASLEVTTTGTLTIAPDEPDRWSTGFDWNGTFTVSDFRLPNLGGSGRPLVVKNISSLGGLVIGDHENVQPSTGDVTIYSEVSIAGGVSVSGGEIDVTADITSGATSGNGVSLTGSRILHRAGFAVTTQGANIGYSATNFVSTADADQVLLVRGNDNNSRPVIDANGGNISLTATFASGGDPGQVDRAIDATFTDIITAGNGTITITGNATNNSNTGSTAWGGQFRNVRVQTEDGNITFDLTGGKATVNSRGFAVDNGTLEVLSETGTITVLDNKPQGLTGTHTGLYLRPSSANAIVFGADGTNVTTSTSDIVIRTNRVTFDSQPTSFNTGGVVSLEPEDASFSSALNTSLVNINSQASGVNLGKSGNTTAISVARSQSIAGPITIHSDSIAINAALTSTGSGDASRISLVGAAANNLNGTVSMSSGSITAGNLLIQNIHNTSLSTGGSVSVDTVAAEGGHRLLLVNDKALTVGEVGGVSGISNYTEFVTLATKTGDLTISQPVGTTGSSSSFQLRVTAGRDTAFGTSTGGDVKVTGDGAFVVPNAVTQVFSGSAVNSTGVSALAAAETVATSAPGVAAGQVAVAYRAGPPSFSSPATMRFGETLSLIVSEPSGGDVTLSKVNAGDPCTLSGTTISPTGVGDCVVEATGDASGFSAQQTITITQAPQSIAFTSSVPANVVAGTTYTPTATATSGLNVAFTISAGSPGVCSLSGGVVTFASSGTCTIEASIATGQAGAANYLAATAVTQTIVAGKINQTITFAQPPDRDINAPAFTVGATVSSDRAVTYSTSTSSVCTVGASTGVVTLVTVGDCTITASSAGNASFADAPDVTRTFTVRAIAPGRTSLTSASFGNGEITVGFTAPSFTGGAPITAYRAIATEVSDPTTSVTQDCGAVSPCVIGGLTNGTAYTVTLQAINSAGVGPASDASPAVTPAGVPQAVTGLVTTPGDSRLIVNWTQPLDLGGGTFTRYDVYVRESGTAWPGTATTTVNTVSTQTVTVMNLTNGTPYDVKVVVITSANGSEIIGTNTTFALGVPVSVPGAPTGFSLTALTATTALAAWTGPVDDGGSPITGYTLSPSCSPDTPTDTSCVITGLTGGSTVTVSLTANNLIGSSASVSETVTLPAAPAPPTQPGRPSRPSSEAPVVVAPTTPPANQIVPPGRAPTPGAAPAPLAGPLPGVSGNNGQAPQIPTALIGGRLSPVNTSVVTPNQLGLQIGNTTLGVSIPDGQGTIASQGGAAELAVEAGAQTRLSGSGLFPGSTVQVFMPLGSNGSREIAQLPVDPSGAFDGDAVFTTRPTDPPLPIGRHVLQIASLNEAGERVIVEMAVTIAQPPPAPEILRTNGDIPGLSPGQSLVTSGGEPIDITLTVDEELSLATVEGDGWSVAIDVSGNRSTIEQVSDDEALVSITQGGEANISGGGFMPLTRVDVWLFSDPVLLGSADVGDSGEFTGAVNFDGWAIPAGEHTLQIQAVGTDGFIIATNLGVVVIDPDTDTTATTEQAAAGVLWWVLALIALLVVAGVVWWVVRRRGLTGGI